MSSLGDIQQMYSMLQEMDRILAKVNTGLNDAELQAKKTATTFRQLESVALRYLVIARRLGLPDNIDAGIQKILQFIVAIRQLDITLKMFQAGMGPIGWATLGASAIMTGLSFYSLGSQ